MNFGEAKMKMRDEPQINKNSDLPNGVSRFFEYDKRLVNPKQVVVFGVCVKDKGKFRVKKFRVGHNVSENEAMGFAIAYRKYYESCLEYNMPFNYDIFKEWDK